MFPFRFRRILPLAFAVSAGALLMACHRHHGPWHEACSDTSAMADKAAKHLSRKLDLTSSQVGEVQKIFRSTFEDGCKIAPEKKALHSALIADLRSNQADTAALALKLGEMQNRLEAMKSTLLSGYAKLHSVLTPEQRQKMAEIMEKRMAD